MNVGGKADVSKESSKTQGTSKQVEQLDISEEGVAKIIEDLLEQSGGLASIFGGEQGAGIFNSSVAAQEAGDFAANVVGEIAKLTAAKTTEKEGFEQTVGRKKSASADFSLL